jgi:hypothetical protein
MDIIPVLFVSSIVSFLGSYYYYYLKTLQKKDIIIVKKYELTKNNVTTYYVIDENDNKYKIDSCIWILHYSHVDLFNKINEKDEYRITTFGFNIPSLDVYPIITSADKICRDYDENYITYKT